MIITIQGTQKNDNDAARVAAALSYIGVAKDKTSTIVLQFMNKTDKNVENYLYGKNLRNESLVQDAEVTDITSGIDALYIHASGGALSGSVFSESTRNIVNIDNMYDIAASSKKDSFEKELVDKEEISLSEIESGDISFLESFLREAEDAYSNVIALIPGTNKKLCKYFSNISDVNIICIKQTRKEPVNVFGKKNLLVVSDYCQGSKFNDKTLKKEYNVQNLYGIMHNINFLDACEDGTLLSFMQKNIDLKKTDINYSLSSQLVLLYNAMNGKGKHKENEEDVEMIKGVNLLETTWEPLTEEDINVKIIKTSGPLWKKSETRNIVVTNKNKDVSDDNNLVNSEDTENTEINTSLENEPEFTENSFKEHEIVKKETEIVDLDNEQFFKEFLNDDENSLEEEKNEDISLEDKERLAVPEEIISLDEQKISVDENETTLDENMLLSTEEDALSEETLNDTNTKLPEETTIINEIPSVEKTENNITSTEQETVIEEDIKDDLQEGIIGNTEIDSDKEFEQLTLDFSEPVTEVVNKVEDENTSVIDLDKELKELELLETSVPETDNKVVEEDLSGGTPVITNPEELDDNSTFLQEDVNEEKIILDDPLDDDCLELEQSIMKDYLEEKEVEEVEEKQMSNNTETNEMEETLSTTVLKEEEPIQEVKENQYRMSDLNKIEEKIDRLEQMVITLVQSNMGTH